MVIMETLLGKVILNLNVEKDTYMQGPKEIKRVSEGGNDTAKSWRQEKVLTFEVSITGIMIRDKSKMTMITLHEYKRFRFLFFFFIKI